MPLSLLQLDSVCFQRWNKIPNYKIMSLLLKRTMTKNVKKNEMHIGEYELVVFCCFVCTLEKLPPDF